MSAERVWIHDDPDENGRVYVEYEDLGFSTPYIRADLSQWGALFDEIREDEDVRQGWVANIAMAIYDTKQVKGETAHQWRNRCAETFLNRLCLKPGELGDVPGMMALGMTVEPTPEKP